MVRMRNNVTTLSSSNDDDDDIRNSFNRLRSRYDRHSS